MEGSVNLSRRSFLRAKASVRQPFRPPWGLPEQDFLLACNRCDKCVAACPTQIVVHGDGGFPEVDFRRGECTFCGACTEQCQTGALRKNKQEGMQPWAYRALIGPACLAEQGVVCRSCGDVCADRAIRFQPRSGGVALPAIRMDACSGCGACVGTCPTQAIAMVNHQEGAMQ